MKVAVLYFAAVRDLAGMDEEVLELPLPVTTLGALARHLESVHPPLAGRLAHVRFALNEEFAMLDDSIAEGDVVALIPPFSGG